MLHISVTCYHVRTLAQNRVCTVVYTQYTHTRIDQIIHTNLYYKQIDPETPPNPIGVRAAVDASWIPITSVTSVTPTKSARKCGSKCRIPKLRAAIYASQRDVVFWTCASILNADVVWWAKVFGVHDHLWWWVAGHLPRVELRSFRSEARPVGPNVNRKKVCRTEMATSIVNGAVQ